MSLSDFFHEPEDEHGNSLSQCDVVSSLSFVKPWPCVRHQHIYPDRAVLAAIVQDSDCAATVPCIVCMARALGSVRVENMRCHHWLAPLAAETTNLRFALPAHDVTPPNKTIPNPDSSIGSDVLGCSAQNDLPPTIWVDFF